MGTFVFLSSSQSTIRKNQKQNYERPVKYDICFPIEGFEYLGIMNVYNFKRQPRKYVLLTTIVYPAIILVTLATFLSLFFLRVLNC